MERDCQYERFDPGDSLVENSLNIFVRNSEIHTDEMFCKIFYFYSNRQGLVSCQKAKEVFSRFDGHRASSCNRDNIDPYWNCNTNVH